MKTVTTFLILLLATGLLSCGKQSEPRQIVILPDVSGSIDRDALQQAFQAIDGLVGQLQRGDRITIIPILGDAQAEISGRIIRFEVPKERRAYDADLRQFRSTLKHSLEEMKSAAITNPGTKTDILGSVELAKEEFQLVAEQPKRLLIILSDFIQEDTSINFRSDHRLADPNNAKIFATHTVKAYQLQFTGVQVYLGILHSSEYMQLSRSRREALQSFWTRCFTASGSPPNFVTDGPGLLDAFRLLRR